MAKKMTMHDIANLQELEKAQYLVILTGDM